jgi:hypothetical protein
MSFEQQMSLILLIYIYIYIDDKEKDSYPNSLDHSFIKMDTFSFFFFTPLFLQEREEPKGSGIITFRLSLEF